MNRPALSILIPAAGSSERLGQPKQLVQYKGNSLLQNAVNVALTLTPCEIIVVTGAHANVVKNSPKDPLVRWIHNSQWSTGIGGSIALGAASVSPESRGLLIILSDQWRIQANDLLELTETWRSDPERIVIAEADGQYMPPVIFPSACFNHLQTLEGYQGARGLLGIYPELLTSVPMQNAAADLDTPSQLDELNNTS